MDGIMMRQKFVLEKSVKIPQRVCVGVAIVLYLINMTYPLIELECWSYGAIIFYCFLWVVYEKFDNINFDWVGFGFVLVLVIESVLLIYFLKDNKVWIEEIGKDKPSKYTNFVEFLRLIFLSQVLLLQINNDKYPLMAINILLFVFWITTYVMLIIMLDKQKIF